MLALRFPINVADAGIANYRRVCSRLDFSNPGIESFHPRRPGIKNYQGSLSSCFSPEPPYTNFQRTRRNHETNNLGRNRDRCGLGIGVDGAGYPTLPADGNHVVALSGHRAVLNSNGRWMNWRLKNAGS